MSSLDQYGAGELTNEIMAENLDFEIIEDLYDTNPRETKKLIATFDKYKKEIAKVRSPPLVTQQNRYASRILEIAISIGNVEFLQHIIDEGLPISGNNWNALVELTKAEIPWSSPLYTLMFKNGLTVAQVEEMYKRSLPVAAVTEKKREELLAQLTKLEQEYQQTLRHILSHGDLKALKKWRSEHSVDELINALDQVLKLEFEVKGSQWIVPSLSEEMFVELKSWFKEVPQKLTNAPSQCMNPIMLEENEIEEYLKDSSNRVLIGQPLRGPSTAICMTVQDLKRLSSNPDNVFFKCIGPKGAFPVSLWNPLVKIPFAEYTAYVSLTDLQDLIDEPILLVSETKTQYMHTASKRVSLLLGSVVSSHACGSGTNKKVWSLAPIEKKSTLKRKRRAEKYSCFNQKHFNIDNDWSTDLVDIIPKKASFRPRQDLQEMYNLLIGVVGQEILTAIAAQLGACVILPELNIGINLEHYDRTSKAPCTLDVQWIEPAQVITPEGNARSELIIFHDWFNPLPNIKAMGDLNKNVLSSIPFQFQQGLKECIANHFVVPMDIRYYRKGKLLDFTHVNYLIGFREEKHWNVYRVEPFGNYLPCVDKYLESAMRAINKESKEKLIFKGNLTTVCPIFNPQTLTNDQLCGAWNMYIMFLILLNPERQLSEILLSLSNISRRELQLKINAFIEFLADQNLDMVKCLE